MTLTTTARSTLAWAFGVCLSILFISLWGRAVVADTDTLGEALAPLMATDAVGDVVAGWMAEELTESGADPALAESTAEVVFRSATVESAFADLVGEVVIAAASTDPAGARIDIRPTIAPAIPEVASTMADSCSPDPDTVSTSELRNPRDHPAITSRTPQRSARS